MLHVWFAPHCGSSCEHQDYIFPFDAYLPALQHTPKDCSSWVIVTQGLPIVFHPGVSPLSGSARDEGHKSDPSKGGPGPEHLSHPKSSGTGRRSLHNACPYLQTHPYCVRICHGIPQSAFMCCNHFLSLAPILLSQQATVSHTSFRFGPAMVSNTTIGICGGVER